MNYFECPQRDLTQYIAFIRGGRGEFVLLYSVVLQLWRIELTGIDASVRIVTKSPKVGSLLIFSISLQVTIERRKIRLIEGNAKCRHRKKLKCKGQVFICLSEAQNPIPRTPYTLYTCIQYTYSHREGGSWTRDKVRGATVHKALSKIPTRLTVYKLYGKHLPRCPFTGQLF